MCSRQLVQLLAWHQADFLYEEWATRHPWELEKQEGDDIAQRAAPHTGVHGQLRAVHVKDCWRERPRGSQGLAEHLGWARHLRSGFLSWDLLQRDQNTEANHTILRASKRHHQQKRAAVHNHQYVVARATWKRDARIPGRVALRVPSPADQRRLREEKSRHQTHHGRCIRQASLHDQRQHC